MHAAGSNILNTLLEGDWRGDVVGVGMVKAGPHSFATKDIVNNPLLLDLYPGTHLLLRDQSWMSKFDNLIPALDLLASLGWQAVGMTFLQNSGELCALVRRVPVAMPKGERWPYDR